MCGVLIVGMRVGVFVDESGNEYFLIICDCRG